MESPTRAMLHLRHRWVGLCFLPKGEDPYDQPDGDEGASDGRAAV